LVLVRSAAGLLVLTASASAWAGGLFLPGSGAISTARAGAAIASADDGEALALNPAGLAKARGTTITVSAALIRYYMEFTRAGTYDDLSDGTQPYEGQPFPTVENDPDPPLGIGSYQPIPVIAIVSDLGGRVKGLHVAAGLYAPNGYPFRDMSNGYQFQTSETGDYSAAPPPTRYDILNQESQLLLPSVAVAYRITSDLHVGARFSAGRAKAKSQLATWGTPLNVEEDVRDDTLFTAEVADGFVPMWSAGLTYRPTPWLELAAVYTSRAVIRGKGTAKSLPGPDVRNADGTPRVIGPRPDALAQCETGGTMEAQKACITVQLPMHAEVGARYKFLDNNGALRGDLELNVGWENWGQRCDFTSEGILEDPECSSPGQYLVVVDSAIYENGMPSDSPTIKTNFVNLGLQDTFSVRLGGSYLIGLDSGDPEAGRTIVLRGGVGYDTRAARENWLRSNFDGAARLTTTLGAAYRTPRFDVNIGGGLVYEGSNTNVAKCNPTPEDTRCNPDGTLTPLDDREGPDPTNPILAPEAQWENPIAGGTYKSHYLLFMLGFSTWF